MIQERNINVDMFIEDVIENNSLATGRASQSIIDNISLNPSLCIPFFLRLIEGGLPDRKLEALFLLIDESFSRISYGIDRGDSDAIDLQKSLQDEINNNLAKLPSEMVFQINNILYDSNLSININETSFQQSFDKNIKGTGKHITPKLPELIEKIRRETPFKTTFELFELILKQIQMMPLSMQLGIVYEMAFTTKPLSHEMTVLMLLHPKEPVRITISNYIAELADEIPFTSVDLRRLILIRNWVANKEKSNIDYIINSIKKRLLTPAPSKPHRILKIMASAIDGAGASSIMFEVKDSSCRKTAGLLTKIGLGIKDCWVQNKTPKNYLDNIIEENSDAMNVPFKEVSLAYLTKVIKHFISENLKVNTVPPALLIETAELLNTKEWNPEDLFLKEELSRLKPKYTNLLDNNKLDVHLQESENWYYKYNFSSYWFECGDVAERSVRDGLAKLNKKDISLAGYSIAKELMKHFSEKWSITLLITLLWMRSKKIDKNNIIIFSILYSINEGTPLEEIPLIQKIAMETSKVVHHKIGI